MSVLPTRSDSSRVSQDAAKRYKAVRSVTTRICSPLSAEDMVVQACTETSPTKWHLAHTTWFFETFILERFEDHFKPYDPAFRVLFNSYYQQVGDRHPRPQRGMLTRPGLGEVWAYRDTTDERIVNLLRSASSEQIAQILPLLELGLNHEQQHQELMFMDIQRLLSLNPVEPAYTPESRADGGSNKRESPAPMRWIAIDAGLGETGYQGTGFHYDNEGPRHRVYLDPFEISSRLVTNAEFIEFIEAGGYRDASLWLEQGWAWVCEKQIECPLYWRPDDGGKWTSFSLRGRRPLAPDAPATHISFFEADAYAKWRGARLPNEAEWERAAAPRWEQAVQLGNFLDRGALAPRAASTGDEPDIVQLGGDVWEWTRSAHEPYPGYRPPEGAIGEYNGKFMCGSFVLRGGSCVTPREHIRLTYRNFFAPDSGWAFTGVRLARDLPSQRRRPMSLESSTTRGAPNLRPTIDGAAEDESFSTDARDGLAGPDRPRSIPPKYLYDAAGGMLFEKIVELDEYYLPRVERELVDRLLPELSQRVGACVTLIEPGAGDGAKAVHLLEGLDAPRMFVPIEVNAEALGRCASSAANAFPELCVQPIRAAFNEGLEALYGVSKSNRLVFFPGSSIGNLDREQRVELLSAFGRCAGKDGYSLVSFDLIKDPGTLRLAYDDPHGVSAAFARNLITRLNRELDAGLDPEAFEYSALWDDQNNRIEMRLTPRSRQAFSIGEEWITLDAGEHVVTEYSHKFTRSMIEDEAAAAGLAVHTLWSDPDETLAVCLMSPVNNARG